MAAAPRPRGSGAETREIQDVALRAERDMEAEGQQVSRTVLLAGAQDSSLSLLATGALHARGSPVLLG